MRLWHKDLITVLPKDQIVGLWRECSAIAGSILKNQTPNHILVNYVTTYDFSHFISYCYYVRKEMTSRGYRTMDSVWNKITSLKPAYQLIPLQSVFPNHHNERYLVQCYFNLQEKYDRGGIPEADWQQIEQALWRPDNEEKL